MPGLREVLHGKIAAIIVAGRNLQVLSLFLTG